MILFFLSTPGCAVIFYSMDSFFILTACLSDFEKKFVGYIHEEVRFMGAIDNAKYKVDQARKQIEDAQYNIRYYREKEAQEAANLEQAQELLQEGEEELQEAVDNIQATTGTSTTGLGF